METSGAVWMMDADRQQCKVQSANWSVMMAMMDGWMDGWMAMMMIRERRRIN